ncbi:MAG: hypothetical protein AAF296_14130 [Pseudomonadota bacterium]
MFRIVMLLSFFAVTAIISANISGYCFEEHRYLSDEELIHGALSRGPHISSARRAFERGKIPHVPSFGSTDAFYEAFPDCCEIVGEEDQKNRQPFWRKAVGDFRGYVSISFELDGVKDEKVAFGPRYVAVTNCGKGWNGVSIGK